MLKSVLFLLLPYNSINYKKVPKYDFYHKTTKKLHQNNFLQN